MLTTTPEGPKLDPPPPPLDTRTAAAPPPPPMNPPPPPRHPGQRQDRRSRPRHRQWPVQAPEGAPKWTARNPSRPTARADAPGRARRTRADSRNLSPLPRARSGDRAVSRRTTPLPNIAGGTTAAAATSRPRPGERITGPRSDRRSPRAWSRVEPPPPPPPAPSKQRAVPRTAPVTPTGPGGAGRTAHSIGPVRCDLGVEGRDRAHVHRRGDLSPRSPGTPRCC